MVNTQTVVIGIAASPSQWFLGGFNSVLAAVNTIITNNRLNVKIYQYFTLTPDQAALAASSFLQNTRFYARRAFIAGSGSADLIAADAVCAAASVPCFSVGASATSIIAKTSNSLTWAPLDRNATMFVFVMHYLYARTNFFIVYDDADDARREFIDSYTEDVRAQAAVFGITVCTMTVDTVTTTLPDDSTILMLASNATIQAAGASRMNCATPNSSILITTDINAGARESYFGANIVPLCLMMYPLEFTTQTREVVQLFTKPNLIRASPYIYALYDCLVTLAKFSLTAVSVTIRNVITFSVSIPDVPTYAFMPSKYICLKNRSPCYCRYVVCFLRQQFISDPVAFLARFDGGHPLFPDSYAPLFQCGFMQNATSFTFNLCNFLQITDGVGGPVLMEKFDETLVITDTATDPFLPPVQTETSLTMGVKLTRDVSDVPVLIQQMQLYGGTLPVSQTMGKTVTVEPLPDPCRPL